MTNSDKKYDVILADPPWRFHVWSKAGQDRSAESHYNTMSIDEICALPVSELVAENCALFLWVVWPSIFQYPARVMDAWGFRYGTCAFLWAKAKKSGFGFFMGMGYYTRANTEPCLLAIRGCMPVVDHGITQLIYSPIRAHSRKPDEQYAKIEALYPNMRYLELFARHKRSGWDVWGNEVMSDIKLSIKR